MWAFCDERIFCYVVLSDTWDEFLSFYLVISETIFCRLAYHDVSPSALCFIKRFINFIGKRRQTAWLGSCRFLRWLVDSCVNCLRLINLQVD